MAQTSNTFQLEPGADEVFYPSRVKAILESHLTERFSKSVFDPTHSAEITDELARTVRAKVKELKMPRYKIAVQIIYGELKGQGLRVASKSLWDPKFDNWTSYTYSNESLFCTAIVFGVYFQ